MKKRGKKNGDEISFWQSQSDLLTALVLILLLIILLLSLYLMQIPDTKYVDMWYGDTSEGGDLYNGGGDGENDLSPTPTPTVTPTPTPSPTPTPTVIPGNGGNGGDDGGDDDGVDEGEFPEEGEEGEKSAVYVMLVDGETDLTIKEEGVLFELYETEGSLQTLTTYYPEKITFRNYETTDDGVFYLPEKIYQGSYYLKELTEAEGYELADDEYFQLDDYYDWPEPYVVRVPVYPSRNIIRLQMLDKETGQTLSGGTFEVKAAENIITSDGTMRYRKGQVVSEIECDEDGYGESGELYLGLYEVVQKTIPDYYAALEEEEFEVDLEKKSDSVTEISELSSERTQLEIHVTDELYNTRPIEGVEFSISHDGSGGAAKTYATDNRGRILLNELEKNTTYYIKQSNTVGDYYPDETEYEVAVSSDGRIDGETKAEMELTNWILRFSIGAVDTVLRSQVSDVNLALYDNSDHMLRSWTTTGNPLEISNLKAGDYYVIVNGNQEKRYDLRVVNTKEVQNLTIPIFTNMSIAALAGGVFAVIMAVFIIVQVTNARKKKAREVQEDAEG